jgi:CheY-like chemotaxis protein
LTVARAGAENPRAGGKTWFLSPSKTLDMSALRILVAEDEAPLREILSEGLREEGFEVVAAADGAQALELFRSAGPFDLLLLDEEMPRLTGRRLLARLRAQGEDVAAVLLSGNLELTPEEQVCLRVGPALRKPMSFTDLSRAIRAAIDSRQT